MPNGTDEEVLSAPLRELIWGSAKIRILWESQENNIARIRAQMQAYKDQIKELEGLDEATLQKMYENWYQTHVQEVNDHNTRVTPMYERLMEHLARIKALRTHKGTAKAPDGVLDHAHGHIKSLLLFRTPRKPEERITPEEFRQRQLAWPRRELKDCQSLLDLYLARQKQHEESLKELEQLERYLNSLPPDLLN